MVQNENHILLDIPKDNGAKEPVYLQCPFGVQRLSIYNAARRAEFTDGWIGWTGLGLLWSPNHIMQRPDALMDLRGCENKTGKGLAEHRLVP